MQTITLDLIYFVHLHEMYFIYFRISFQWAPSNETWHSTWYNCLNPSGRNQEATELNVGHCYTGPMDMFTYGDLLFFAVTIPFILNQIW